MLNVDLAPEVSVLAKYVRMNVTTGVLRADGVRQKAAFLVEWKVSAGKSTLHSCPSQGYKELAEASFLVSRIRLHLDRFDSLVKLTNH